MRIVAVSLAALALIGCRQDMHDQPRYELNVATDMFGDRRAARPAIPGTVPRGVLKVANPGLWTGKNGQKTVEQMPFAVTKEILDRGQDRYNIYCSPCHGLTGKGDGVIVSRGLKQPPSYHTEALRESTNGHIFDVITNGNGSMFSYAARIPVEDRWAIVAWVRVLQQSQNVPVADLPAEERKQVEASQ